MMLGFKRRFAPMVEDGSKTHTIRAKRKPSKLGYSQRSPRVGEVANCYVDPRQKTMRLLGRWPVHRVEDIRIILDYEDKVPSALYVWINGCSLDKEEMNQLCWRDGFRSRLLMNAWREFSEFWIDEHGKSTRGKNTLEFNGQLIHWDFTKPVERKKVGK